MGLTLHYSARLRQMERLPELLDEVADICQSIQWSYRRLDKIDQKTSNTNSLGKC